MGRCRDKWLSCGQQPLSQGGADQTYEILFGFTAIAGIPIEYDAT